MHIQGNLFAVRHKTSGKWSVGCRSNIFTDGLTDHLVDAKLYKLRSRAEGFMNKNAYSYIHGHSNISNYEFEIVAVALYTAITEEIS